MKERVTEIINSVFEETLQFFLFTYWGNFLLVLFGIYNEMQTKQDIIDNLEQEAQDESDQEGYDPRY